MATRYKPRTDEGDWKALQGLYCQLLCTSSLNDLIETANGEKCGEMSGQARGNVGTELVSISIEELPGCAKHAFDHQQVFSNKVVWRKEDLND